MPGFVALAEAPRSRFADGYFGWLSPRHAATGTPIYELRSRLQPKVYKLLERHGFTAVEELHDVPDNA